MIRLLPNRFKRVGAVIAPAGFILWIAVQVGWIANIAQSLGVADPRYLNIALAVLGGLSFLFGSYALTFSKENIEDEMIKNVRLESFQFAALLQMLFLILGILLIPFMERTSIVPEVWLTLFLIITIFIFWITYIIRFNYIVHVGVYRYEK